MTDLASNPHPHFLWLALTGGGFLHGIRCDLAKELNCFLGGSLSWLDEDQDEAFKGIRKLIADTVKDMEKANEPVPVPLAKREFSGVFKVRIPASVHRALVLEAAEAGVSLNRVASAKLSK